MGSLFWNYIIFITMTANEFEKKLEDKDILCLLAEYLAKDVLHTSLKNSSQPTRDRFLERALEEIKNYEKFGIKLSAL